MAASCSLVVVNYRSAPLAIEAVRTARAATGRSLQVIIVDNSVDPKEADALRGSADVLIVADKNLGYGTAINRARAKCDGEVMVVCNPDVRFGANAIDLLLEANADVAGPALFWDDAFTWFLPPSDLHTGADAFDAAMASRFRRWRRSRERHRIEKRLNFWSLRRATSVPALSGAVMAIRRAAFDRAGGFDERFHLYFEEIDFQRRLRGGIVYVPASRCRHLYNQSAGQSASAPSEYATSELQYLEKWSGRRLARRIKRIERPMWPAPALPLDGDIPIEGEDLVVEASPLPSFETAAGHFPATSRVSIPPEVWDSYRGEALYLRVIDMKRSSVVAAYVKTKIRP